MDSNQDVFTKTRELSDCISNCDIYKNMKAAEEKVMANEHAAVLIMQYTAYDDQVKQMMFDCDKDFTRLKALNSAMNDLKSEMEMYDEFIELSRARDEFAALMRQVNAMLKFLLVDSSDDILSQCDKCSSCGGCEGSERNKRL